MLIRVGNRRQAVMDKRLIVDNSVILFVFVFDCFKKL